MSAKMETETMSSSQVRLAESTQPEAPRQPVRRWQVSTVALTFAAAAMLAAGVLSLVTGLSRNSWSVVLMAAINLTAWSVYSRMIDATRNVRAHMRYLDWMVRLPPLGARPRLTPVSSQVTLPLLALKLVDMARTDGTASPTGLFASKYLELLVATMAFLTIAVSYYAVAGFGVTLEKAEGRSYNAFVTCFLISLACMGTSLGLIYALAGQTTSTHLPNIITFSVPWAGYAAVYTWRANMWIDTHVEDSLYAILDVFCKSVFALVVLFNLH